MWRVVLGLVAIVGCNSGPCPGDPPANGATCQFHTDGVGDSCEYGGDKHGLCTTFASCGEDSGSDMTPRWHLTVPSATCSINAATCPATFGAMEGSACQPTNNDCEYDEGVCGCEFCERQGAQSSYWHCRPWTDVAAGCPVPRQRVGESCDHEGLYCNYGRCCSPPSLGASLVCKDGTWRSYVDTACACVMPQCP